MIVATFAYPFFPSLVLLSKLSKHIFLLQHSEAKNPNYNHSDQTERLKPHSSSVFCLLGSIWMLSSLKHLPVHNPC